MESGLNDEFEYYLENRIDLAEKYDGRYIVIKNRDVIGDYDTKRVAIETTMKTHVLGTFLVQKCSSDPDSIKQRFLSRAYFS
ncbi:MAG: hypothetical protein OXG62_10850 [Nitrospinae bacterium]|nr:hypothetical protein [Nitrospinota bacterium]